MLTMAVSFFTLIAGSVGKIDKYIGCQSKFKGIFKYWDEIDQYIIAADTALCGKNCPCDMSKYSIQMYKNNPITKEMFNAYFNINEKELKDSQSDSMIKIQSCQDKTSLRSSYKNLFKSKNIDGFNGKIFEGFDATLIIGCRSGYKKGTVIGSDGVGNGNLRCLRIIFYIIVVQRVISGVVFYKKGVKAGLGKYCPVTCKNCTSAFRTEKVKAF